MLEADLSDQCHLVKVMDMQAVIIVLGDQGCQGQWEYKEKRHLGGKAKVALEWSPRKQAWVCSVRGEKSTHKTWIQEAPQQWSENLSGSGGTDRTWPWNGGLSLDVEDCVFLSYGWKDTSGKTGEGNEQCEAWLEAKERWRKKNSHEPTYENSYFSSWAESSCLKHLHM